MGRANLKKHRITAFSGLLPDPGNLPFQLLPIYKATNSSISTIEEQMIFQTPISHIFVEKKGTPFIPGVPLLFNHLSAFRSAQVQGGEEKATEA